MFIVNYFKLDNIETYGVPYDYDSIMHYHGLGPDGLEMWQIKDGQIVERIEGQTAPYTPFGRRDGTMSELDKELLNKMYNCPWPRSR